MIGHCFSRILKFLFSTYKTIPVSLSRMTQRTFHMSERTEFKCPLNFFTNYLYDHQLYHFWPVVPSLWIDSDDRGCLTGGIGAKAISPYKAFSTMQGLTWLSFIIVINLIQLSMRTSLFLVHLPGVWRVDIPPWQETVPPRLPQSRGFIRGKKQASRDYFSGKQEQARANKISN